MGKAGLKATYFIALTWKAVSDFSKSVEDFENETAFSFMKISGGEFHKSQRK